MLTNFAKTGGLWQIPTKCFTALLIWHTRTSTLFQNQSQHCLHLNQYESWKLYEVFNLCQLHCNFYMFCICENLWSLVREPLRPAFSKWRKRRQIVPKANKNFSTSKYSFSFFLGATTHWLKWPNFFSGITLTDAMVRRVSNEAKNLKENESGGILR